MSKAWFVIPSARPIAEVLPVVEAWKNMGYGVALWRDDKHLPDNGEAYAITADSQLIGSFVGADLVFLSGKYPGYAQSVNAMAKHVLSHYPEVDWIVCAGDDTTPDPNKTGDEIADELTSHFWREALGNESLDTFGVVQCTGDRWADNLGVIIERIAGSPWLGREWCRRAHAGKGPLWPEFRHMFGDQALMDYAQSLGVFLQRPDLTHYHAHAQRDGKSRPATHMTEWNSQQHWQESKAIFERLKSTNFAECQPIP